MLLDRWYKITSFLCQILVFGWSYQKKGMWWKNGGVCKTGTSSAGFALVASPERMWEMEIVTCCASPHLWVTDGSKIDSALLCLEDRSSHLFWADFVLCRHSSNVWIKSHSRFSEYLCSLFNRCNNKKGTLGDSSHRLKERWTGLLKG